MTCVDIAQRFIGEREVAGASAAAANPLIQYWFTLCGLARDTPDETPWCSAFAQFAPFLLRLPRSKSARARSWLRVGLVVDIERATVGNDVVVLKRGGGDQPGADVIDAPGHVGFFMGMNAGKVWVLGGNQADGVNTAPFAPSLVLGVRRLAGGL